MFDIPYASNIDISSEVVEELPVSIKIVPADYQYYIEVNREQIRRNNVEVNVCKIITSTILAIILTSSILHLIYR